MDLLLKNHPNLVMTSISDNAKSKCTGLMIENCKQTTSKAILDSVIAKQGETGQTKNLKRFRVDLPYDNTTDTNKHTGTYAELMSYPAVLVDPQSEGKKGYDSSGTAQVKPAFVGTWTISDYTDQTLRDNVAAAYQTTGDNPEPGIVHAAQLPEWSTMSVQSLDSTKSATWNPAVAIVLQANGKGTVHENTQHWQDAGCGKWWITKEEAAAITDIGTWFQGKASNNVTDTNKIVNSTAATAQVYSFTDFSQFADFTGVTEIDANAFNGCSVLTTLPLDNRITSIGSSAFRGCSVLVISTLPNLLTAIPDYAFYGCGAATISEIPAGVTSIGSSAFYNCTALTNLHLLNQGFILLGANAFYGTSASLHLYFGNNESHINDEQKLQMHLADSVWVTYAAKMATWYSHENALPDGYTTTNYVQSDGINIFDTGLTMDATTRFVTDIGFAYNFNSDTSIHGTTTNGLKGDLTNGLRVKMCGEDLTLGQSKYWMTGEVHNYDVDFKAKKVTIDQTTSITPTDLTQETTFGSEHITMFGTTAQTSTVAGDAFVGQCWMTRIYQDVDGVRTLKKNYIPCYRNSDYAVGFYDSVGETFEGYTTWSCPEVTRLLANENGTDVITTENGETIEL